jgi:glycosyltransferase involved in cell wall biosynthesis
VVGDAAYLHPFGDIGAMAASLDALLESPETARQTGERGRQRAETNFTAERVVPQYEALYRSVLED